MSESNRGLSYVMMVIEGYRMCMKVIESIVYQQVQSQYLLPLNGHHPVCVDTGTALASREGFTRQHTNSKPQQYRTGKLSLNYLFSQ